MTGTKRNTLQWTVIVPLWRIACISNYCTGQQYCNAGEEAAWGTTEMASHMTARAVRQFYPCPAASTRPACIAHRSGILQRSSTSALHAGPIRLIFTSGASTLSITSYSLQHVSVCFVLSWKHPITCHECWAFLLQYTLIYDCCGWHILACLSVASFYSAMALWVSCRLWQQNGQPIKLTAHASHNCRTIFFQQWCHVTCV